MLIALHKNARTTPAVRAEIAASAQSASALARRYGITEQTVYKWKTREVFGDRSHTAHRLQTILTPAQETVVVHLRRTLLLPLDDLLAVTREFLCPDVSRSGLDRCLRRHGVGNLNALKPATPQEPHKACPIRLNKLLTDNGKEFTARLFASRERQPSGRHEFAQF